MNSLIFGMIPVAINMREMVGIDCDGSERWWVLCFYFYLLAVLAICYYAHVKDLCLKYSTFPRLSRKCY